MIRSTHINLEQTTEFESIYDIPFIHDSRFIVNLPDDLDALEKIGRGILEFVQSQREQVATP